MKCEQKMKAVVAYRLTGHSIAETAEHFGLKHSTVKGYCNKAGVRAGYAKGGPIKSVQQREADAVDLIESAWMQWEYVDGFDGSASRVKLRCRKCGHICEWSMISLRHYGCKKICPVCGKVMVRDVLNIPTYMRSWEADEKERLKTNQGRKKNEYKRHRCPICEKMTTNKIYCSIDCSRKADNAAHDLKKRMFAKSKIVDKDITLQKLYLRDKGICWICGMMCDYSDYRRTEKAFIAGNLYPSIDHVIPRCEGGEHSWKNIRLAHRKCNTARYSWDRRKEHTQSYIAM